MAAISPPLFVLISRVSPGLSPWYVMLTVAALPALFRWPEAARSTARLQLVHRLSALLLGIFVLGHIANQSLAFVSVSSYTAMRSVMRVASQQPISYAVIVASVAMQVATGIAMGMKKVRAGAMTANLQAVTGWYLAAFLLTHVFSGLVLAQHGVPTAVVATSSQFDLLASARSTAQLPFLLLGVAAFLFHIGAYARLMALAYLAEASVRRLSYAAMVVGTTVVLTVGLALCGIHLMR
jgi:succinate dehydrogenase/fumarate reductase cytochrome b subunit